MEYPRGKKQHFRHLLFTFHQGQKAAEAAWDICMVYGEGVIGKSMARKWLAKFKNCNFDIDDMTRSRRPSEFDKDPFQSTFEGGKSPNKLSIGQKNKLPSKNNSQLSSFNGICRKIRSLDAS